MSARISCVSCLEAWGTGLVVVMADRAAWTLPVVAALEPAGWSWWDPGTLEWWMLSRSGSRRHRRPEARALREWSPAQSRSEHARAGSAARRSGPATIRAGRGRGRELGSGPRSWGSRGSNYLRPPVQAGQPLPLRLPPGGRPQHWEPPPEPPPGGRPKQWEPPPEPRSAGAPGPLLRSGRS